jgi:hypothetical protein
MAFQKVDMTRIKEKLGEILNNVDTDDREISGAEDREALFEVTKRRYKDIKRAVEQIRDIINP